MGKLWLKKTKTKTKQESNLDHLHQAAKDNVKWENYYIQCIFLWNSAGRRFLKLVKHWKMYLRKMRHNYLLLLLTFRPPFPPSFFPFFLRTGYSSTSLRNWICQNWNTLTSVINMIRITFTVLIFRVIVKEVILKVLPQIQKREWWQKLNLFICYGGNFWRQFVCFSFPWHPRKKCACVSHEMTQFVLKK